jgi:hypothetical protein
MIELLRSSTTCKCPPNFRFIARRILIMTSTSPPVTPGAMLGQAPGGELDAAPELNGFGGFHGGLTLGLVAAAMRDALGAEAAEHELPDHELRSLTGRFRRAVDGRFRITVGSRHVGRRSSTASAVVDGAKGPCVEANAVFGPGFATGNQQGWPVVEPVAPAASPPDDLEVFAIPTEFAPVGAHTEIRPVGPNRPYAGGAEPELTAWVRLVEDDRAPDLPRFVFLMDALAPSYAAVLSTLAAVPTVEFTVRPAAALAGADSPWVLLHAATIAAGPGGWVSERIAAWDPAGVFLGWADQLRVVRTG